MAKRYHIATQNGYITPPGSSYGAATFTKAEARKALADIVREDAQACRRSHKRCSVIGSVRSGGVEIKIGGRQGYHLWQRYSINEDRS